MSGRSWTQTKLSNHQMMISSRLVSAHILLRTAGRQVLNQLLIVSFHISWPRFSVENNPLHLSMNEWRHNYSFGIHSFSSCRNQVVGTGGAFKPKVINLFGLNRDALNLPSCSLDILCSILQYYNVFAKKNPARCWGSENLSCRSYPAIMESLSRTKR